MNEVNKIMYDLGYYDADPQKERQIQGYITEAEEFLVDAGVPKEKITSQRAYAIKSIWADGRDKGTPNSIISKDGMIVSLISQLRR